MFSKMFINETWLVAELAYFHYVLHLMKNIIFYFKICICAVWIQSKCTRFTMMTLSCDICRCLFYRYHTTVVIWCTVFGILYTRNIGIFEHEVGFWYIKVVLEWILWGGSPAVVWEHSISFTCHVTSDKDSWERRQFVTNLTIAFKGQAIASSCHDPFGTIISALINKVSSEYQLEWFLSACVSYSFLKFVLLSWLVIICSCGPINQIISPHINAANTPLSFTTILLL